MRSQKKFNNNGFTAVPCYNGQDAIEHMRKEKYDFILLDILMPVKDGYAVLEEKPKTMNAHTPIAVLTALGQEENLARARHLGATECFVKSEISMNDVIQRVREILGMNE